MFTSLRFRLWLSYAFVIAIALSIVLMVLLAFLIRNPVRSRQVQERLRTVQSLITATPRRFVDNPKLLEELARTQDVRILLFNADRYRVSSGVTFFPFLPAGNRQRISFGIFLRSAV